MPYHDFTLEQLRTRFGLTILQRAGAFEAVPEVPPPARLLDIIADNTLLAVNSPTEKGRSELLAAPVLFRLALAYPDRIAVFSGEPFDVDAAADLKGRCDFLISRDPSVLDLAAPVCVAVEGKHENLVAGIPQCLAEMVAVQRFNAARGKAIAEVGGVVTSGLLWRFMKLEDKLATIDLSEYRIDQIAKVFGILTRLALGPSS